MGVGMQRQYRRLHVLAFEQKRLTSQTLARLEAVRITDVAGETPSAALGRRMSYPIDDVAVIDKCNAVIVVAALMTDADDAYVRERLLHGWMELAPGLAPHLRRVKHFRGRSAVQYLGEVAVGLRSVVVGDSQVYAQVLDGLRGAGSAADHASAFEVLIRRLRPLLHSVCRNTSLQQGKTSLERVGCQRLIAHLGGEVATEVATVAIVGLGRTGRLMADILSKETSHRLLVTNRTSGHVSTTWYRDVEVHNWGDLSFVDRADAVLLCLANNVETKAFAEKLVHEMRTDRGRPQLLLDMSSPPLTGGVSNVDGGHPVPITIMRIDQLSSDAAANLSARGHAVNKAKQIVSDWAVETEHQLLASLLYRSHVSGAAHAESAQPLVSAARGVALNRLRMQLIAAGFTEIQTPCLLPATKDQDPGGAAEFAVAWRGSGLVLRRSAQLYRQIALLDGLERVYEIGPQWQPDSVRSPADVVETQILGVELREAALDRLYALALQCVDAVLSALGKPGVPPADAVPVLSFDEAVTLLRDAGHQVSFGDELGFASQHFLAEQIRARFDRNIFVVCLHPPEAHDFYVATDPDTGRGKTFEIIVDGWRVASGALRETDREVMSQRMLVAGLRPAQYDYFLSRFHNAPAHGGFVVGLDRLLARALGYPTARSVAPMVFG